MEPSTLLLKTTEEYIKVMNLVSGYHIVRSTLGEKLPIGSNLFDKAYEEENVTSFASMEAFEKWNHIFSLISRDSGIIPLEIWGFVASWPCQPNTLETVRSEMNILMENINKTASTTLSARLSTAIPMESVFIHHRKYADKDPKFETLGENFTETNVGQVRTSLGTVSVKIYARTRFPNGPTENEYLEGDKMFEQLKCLVTTNKCLVRNDDNLWIIEKECNRVWK